MRHRFYTSGLLLLWSSCLLVLTACGQTSNSTTISLSLATPTVKFVGRAESELAYFDGLTEIEPIPRMAESMIYKYSIGNFKEWQFLSDEPPNKVAQIIDTALRKAGYDFSVPRTKQPYYSSINKAYNGGYHKKNEPDDLLFAVFTPEIVLKDFAKAKAAAPDFFNTYFTQLENRKSYVIIMAAPNLIEILTNPAPTPTP